MSNNGINNLADQLKRSKIENGKNVADVRDLKQLLKSSNVGLTS